MLYKLMIIALFLMLNIHYISGEGSPNSPNNDPGEETGLAEVSTTDKDPSESPLDGPSTNDNDEVTESPLDQDDQGENTESPNGDDQEVTNKGDDQNDDDQLDDQQDDIEQDGDDLNEDEETEDESRSGSDSNNDGNSDSSDDPENDSQSGEESDDDQDDDVCFGVEVKDECEQFIDDDGDLECNFNEKDNECYSVSRSRGNLGFGTFDDGYKAAQIEHDDKSAQLEILCGILGGIIAALLVVIGVMAYWMTKQSKNKKETLRKQSLDMIDVEENNGRLITRN